MIRSPKGSLVAEFAYLALDTQGRERRGQVAANDADDARAKLTVRKLYVVKVEAATGVAPVSSPLLSSTQIYLNIANLLMSLRS